jgi:hypothetical protein
MQHSNFILPNYTESKPTPGPKSGGVVLPEFIVRWEYNGDGKIVVYLNDENENQLDKIVWHEGH